MELQKMKILKSYIIIFLSLFSSITWAQNYLTNGSFEQGLKNWKIQTGINGSTIRVVNDTEDPLNGEISAKILIDSSGLNATDSRLTAYFTAHLGHALKVKYKVRANKSSFFNLEICRNYPPYTALYRSLDSIAGINIPVDSLVKEDSLTIIPVESDANMMISFLLGNVDSSSIIWLDDVQINEMTTEWDGNILPNGEFDEYIIPTDPAFPAYRKKKLFWGTSPNDQGGWEGGYKEAASDIVFDIDTNAVLSGKNSAIININDKNTANFFDGCYTTFFQANQGCLYELTFDAVASKTMNITVAMNRQPFSNPPEYVYASDRFSEVISLSTIKKSFRIRTADTLLNQGMHQIFFANYPTGGPAKFWLDHVKLKEIPLNEIWDPADTLTPGYAGNPIIRHMFTADPAAMVHNDTFFIYTGHDEAPEGGSSFYMRDWHVFSSTDLLHWTDHGAKLSINTFSWAKQDAWAGQCVERNGKFWWFVPVGHKTIGWFSIGVAVSDSPAGPFTDAKGSALITDDTPNSVELNIDPTVFVDDDGQAYIIWGGWGYCRMAKLKDNMINLDGEIVDVPGLTGYTEAPWLHKRNGIYYLSFAAGFPETIDYATSSSPLGPWTYRGRINDRVYNSPTNHQSIVQYRGKWYFVYHNGGLPTGGEYRRSVCIDQLEYSEDGTIVKIKQTIKGIIFSEYTKIEDINDRNSLILYPNPIDNNQLNINLLNIKSRYPARLDLFNLEGKLVFSNLINNGQIETIDLKAKPGIYFVRIISDNQLFTNKIIIN
jgi:hypothetical protein